MSFQHRTQRRAVPLPPLPSPDGLLRALLPPPTRLVEALPGQLQTRVLCRIGNHLIRSQQLADRLEPVDGRRVCIAATDTDTEWCFNIEGGRLLAAPRFGGWDVRISGRLQDLAMLALGREHADTLFFARRLALEGETESGVYVKNLLAALDFDWELELAAVLGPRRAASALDVLRRTGLDRPLARAAHAAGDLATRLMARPD